MGFTKLDEGIIQSSIMAEDPATFKIWIALLASCGPDGIAPVSSFFLSSVCRLGIEAVDASIKILESPDKRSRSLEEEGRRIRRVDGGYFVINYEKYRAFSYSKNEEAVRKRKHRERLKQGHLWDTQGQLWDTPGQSGTCPGQSGTCPGRSSLYISSLSSLKEGGMGGEKEDLCNKIEKEFEDFWRAYPPDKGDRGEARNAFYKLRKTIELQSIVRAYEGYMDYLKDKRNKEHFEQSPMYASKFLHKDKWKRFLDYKSKPPL